MSNVSVGPARARSAPWPRLPMGGAATGGPVASDTLNEVKSVGPPSHPVEVLDPGDGTGAPAPDGRPEGSLVELWVGVALVASVALGGLYLSIRPAAGTFDRWLGDLVPQSHSVWLTDVNRLRYPAIIVIGSVIAAAVCVRRDRWRALACLVSPPSALLACELVMKPLVGRTLGGALSYPSGSTVGAAALAMVAVLAVPARWRAVTAVVASAYALWVAVAVVSLQWHFPTDAVAGLAFGVGVVLLADGVVGLISEHLDRRAVGQGSQGSQGGSLPQT